MGCGWPWVGWEIFVPPREASPRSTPPPCLWFACRGRRSPSVPGSVPYLGEHPLDRHPVRSLRHRRSDRGLSCSAARNELTGTSALHPSHDTFGNVFMRLDSRQPESALHTGCGSWPRSSEIKAWHTECRSCSAQARACFAGRPLPRGHRGEAQAGLLERGILAQDAVKLERDQHVGHGESAP